MVQTLQPSNEKIKQYLEILPDWQIIVINEVEQLQRQYSFKNFVEAMAFANKVGELAEEHNHHPAILIEWGKCQVNWWTHTLNGLADNDFILAAQSDALFTTAN